MKRIQGVKDSSEILKNKGSFVKKLKKTSLKIGCHSGLSGIFLCCLFTFVYIQKDSRRASLARMTLQAGVRCNHISMEKVVFNLSTKEGYFLFFADRFNQLSKEGIFVMQKLMKFFIIRL